MPALPGQQRPAAADAGPVIRPAVLVLAISVVDIAVPDWAVWRLGPQQRVGEVQRALNQRIVGTAKSKTHELQKFGADLLVGAEPAAIVGAIADRHDEGARGGSGRTRALARWSETTPGGATRK